MQGGDNININAEEKGKKGEGGRREKGREKGEGEEDACEHI